MKRSALVKAIVKRCLRKGIAFADVETTDDVYDAGIGAYHGHTYESRPSRTPIRRAGVRVFGVALADDKLRTCFVRVYEPLFKRIRTVLASRAVKKVWHNYAYDKIHCDVSDIVVRSPFEDTLLMARIWDDSKPHGLKPLYSLLTGEPADDEKDLKDDLRRKKAASTRSGNPRGYVNYSFAERRIMDRYARGDVFKTGILYGFLSVEIREFWDLYRLDKRCVSLAVAMTHRGMAFDVGQARTTLKAAERLAGKIEKKLGRSAESAGIADFAPSKNAKVAELLIATGVPDFLLNRKGKPSVAADILSGLPANGITSKEAEQVMQYRRTRKLSSTYLKPLLTCARYHDGAIHAQWHTGGARSGRFTSSTPSMQVLTRNTTAGSTVGGIPLRAMLVPRKGFVNLYVDYSQVELRDLAALTQDPAMLDAYRNGSDLHALTSTFLHISRQDAKPVNFGIVYGEGAAALAASLKIPFAKAAYFIKTWFESYPSVEEKRKELQKQLHYNGYVEDFFGRRYYYPAGAPHKAINAVIQGGCSYLLKRAMVNVHDRVLKHIDGAQLIGCIHDEIVPEIPEKAYSRRVAHDICAAMEDMPDFTCHGVKLVAEASVAYDDSNWANKKGVKR